MDGFKAPRKGMSQQLDRILEDIARKERNANQAFLFDMEDIGSALS